MARLSKAISKSTVVPSTETLKRKLHHLSDDVNEDEEDDDEEDDDEEDDEDDEDGDEDEDDWEGGRKNLAKSTRVVIPLSKVQ